MNQAQALKFWQALEKSTCDKDVIHSFMFKIGYDGESTLRRYVKAFRKFEAGNSLEEVVKYTGWRLATIKQIHQFWQEYRNINVPGDNSSHEESPHSQQIQESAKALPSQIDLPFIADRIKAATAESPHSQQIQESAKTLLSQIDFPFIGDRLKAVTTTSPCKQPKRERFAGSVLMKGLFGHLQTGGYAQVLDAIADFDQADADNLASCHRLLDSVKTDIEQKYNISIPLIDNESHGFTISFVQMVCADAIERARGTNHYQGFSYRYDGLNLKFGAYIIYRGIPGEDLKHIEDLHRARRESYSVRKKTKDIADQMKSIGQTQEAIRQDLETFSLLSRLPGTCLLC